MKMVDSWANLDGARGWVLSGVLFFACVRCFHWVDLTCSWVCDVIMDGDVGCVFPSAVFSHHLSFIVADSVLLIHKLILCYPQYHVGVVYDFHSMAVSSVCEYAPPIRRRTACCKCQVHTCYGEGCVLCSVTLP